MRRSALPQQPEVGLPSRARKRFARAEVERLGDRQHDRPLRKGRAIGWFLEALEPAADEFGEQGLLRLAMALRAVCGIETRVWLKDVAGLPDEDVRRTQLWMATALVVQAQGGSPPLPTP